MPIDSKTLGWWTFNQTLEDQAHNQHFEAEATPSYSKHIRFDFNTLSKKSFYGLNLLDNSFSASIGSLILSSAYRLGMGFWYYSPVALGQTKHEITREVTPKILPVIGKATTETSDGYETITNGEFIVSEIGISPTQNAIQIAVLKKQTGHEIIRHIFTSSPYDPGLNHIFITLLYSNSRNYSRIDVNGIVGDQFAAISNHFVLSNTATSLSINKLGFGYTSHKSSESTTRFISDLVIRKDASTYAMQTFEMLNFGAEHIANNSVIEPESPSKGVHYDFVGFGYKQPGTITTTSLLTNNSHIIVGRSNGDLLSGERPIWDNNIEFNKDKSLANVTVSGNGTSEITPDGLKLNNTKIRL